MRKYTFPIHGGPSCVNALTMSKTGWPAIVCCWSWLRQNWPGWVLLDTYSNSTLFLYSSLALVYIHLTMSANSVLSSTVNCRCRHTSVTSQAPASFISASSISLGAHLHYMQHIVSSGHWSTVRWTIVTVCLVCSLFCVQLFASFLVSK